MRIDKLRHIIEVADAQSITVAANRLFVTQPNLSQSIIAIEKELGIKIFKRSKNGTHLTEAGQHVIDSARKIVKEEKKMMNFALQSNSQPVGSISIATIPSFGTSFLPKTIGKFKSNFPRIQIKVNEGGSHFVNEQLLMEKADIGLLSKSKNNFIDNENIVFKPLIKSNVKVLVNKDSDLSKKNSLHPEEIIKYDIVILNNHYNINSYIYNLLKPYGEPNFFFTTNNPEVMKKMILESSAIGFYSDLALVTDPYVQNGTIIPIDIEDQNTERDFGLIYKSNIERVPYIEEFIDELLFQCDLFKKIHNYSNK